MEQVCRHEDTTTGFLMKGKAGDVKRCHSLSVQKLDGNLKEALWPPELPLPGSRQVRRALHSGSACSVHSPPFQALLTAPKTT